MMIRWHRSPNYCEAPSLKRLKLSKNIIFFNEPFPKKVYIISIICSKFAFQIFRRNAKNDTSGDYDCPIKMIVQFILLYFNFSFQWLRAVIRTSRNILWHWAPTCLSSAVSSLQGKRRSWCGSGPKAWITNPTEFWVWGRCSSEMMEKVARKIFYLLFWPGR